MTTEQVKMKRVASMIEQLVLFNIRWGIRAGANYYEANKVSNNEDAINQLKRGIILPKRARAIINAKIAKLGIDYIRDCIELEGTTTIAELQSELTTFEGIMQGLIDRRVNDGDTWDSLSATIIADIEDESEDWSPVIPPEPDVWGE